MKYVFSIAAIMISTLLLAQLPTDENSLVNFSDVVQLEGKSQDELFKRAKFWMVSTLKSGDNMVELDGSKMDQLVGTGNIYLDDFVINYRHIGQNILNFKVII